MVISHVLCVQKLRSCQDLGEVDETYGFTSIIHVLQRQSIEGDGDEDARGRKSTQKTEKSEGFKVNMFYRHQKLRLVFCINNKNLYPASFFPPPFDSFFFISSSIRVRSVVRRCLSGHRSRKVGLYGPCRSHLRLPATDDAPLKASQLRTHTTAIVTKHYSDSCQCSQSAQRISKNLNHSATNN